VIPTDWSVNAASKVLGDAIDGLVKSPSQNVNPKETLVQLHQVTCRLSSLIEALNGEGYLDSLYEAAEQLEEQAARWV
jgi:hypothetical protein